MFKKLTLSLCFSITFCTSAFAADQIRAVGSSTVYPFMTTAAETFSRQTSFKTPIVEPIGSGGGFILFCAGEGNTHVDISNASREMNDRERDLCKKNNVIDFVELKIGYDGIIVANSVEREKLHFTNEIIFKAIAREVPQDGNLVANPYKLWSDIDPKLPKKKIEIYGPPSTSGTRDAFADIILEPVCMIAPEFIKKYENPADRKRACHILREDGAYIESSENDNLIVQKIKNNPDAFGIFGFSFLYNNETAIHGNYIDEVLPSIETISSKTYPVSRPLYLYVKKSNLKATDGLKDFLKEVTSDKAIGQDGYLVEKGLITLSKDELAETQKKVLKF